MNRKNFFTTMIGAIATLLVTPFTRSESHLERGVYPNTSPVEEHYDFMDRWMYEGDMMTQNGTGKVFIRLHDKWYELHIEPEPVLTDEGEIETQGFVAMRDEKNRQLEQLYPCELYRTGKLDPDEHPPHKMFPNRYLDTKRIAQAYWSTRV